MGKITGRYLNELWDVGVKHALYREDGRWYHHLTEFPGALFDINGYIVFNSITDYMTSPHLRHKVELSIPNGICQMPGYIKIDERQENGDITVDVNNEVIRKRREVSGIIRNQQLVYKIKQIYQNICQICGTKLMIHENRFYSEVHHIRPLGQPYYGLDVLENMICVCPNHHVLLDLGGITLDKDKMIISTAHLVSDEQIKYHNTVIFGRTKL